MLACLREGRDQLLVRLLQVDHRDLRELASRQVDRFVFGCHPQAAAPSTQSVHAVFAFSRRRPPEQTLEKLNQSLRIVSKLSRNEVYNIKFWVGIVQLNSFVAQLAERPAVNR